MAAVFARHYEVSGVIPAAREQVFAHLDDHARLSSHMSNASWRMGGGKMSIEVDDRQGRSVGSRIRLSGRVLGILLAVEEIVTERDPPHRKVWETIDRPRLLVIDQYRLGFEIAPAAKGSLTRVFIDYSLPRQGIARWLGLMFGNYYARWCTHRMLQDAARHFSATAGAQAPGGQAWRA